MGKVFRNSCTIALLTAMLPALAEDISVVMSSKNPAVKLNAEQVSNIFLGKNLMLPDGKSLVALDQPGGSPVRETFYQKVTNKSDKQLKAYWAKLVFTGAGEPPKEIASAHELKKLVASNPNTISYVSSSDVDSSLNVLFTVQ